MTWIPFDYEDKQANPLPPNGEPVWVYDDFYSGVTIGWYWNWWETHDSKDDCHIDAWMPIVKPAPPGGVSGRQDQDSDGTVLS